MAGRTQKAKAEKLRALHAAGVLMLAERLGRRQRRDDRAGRRAGDRDHQRRHRLVARPLPTASA